MKKLSVTLGEHCPDCQAKQNEDSAVLRVNAIFQFDPTRTTTLRYAFTREMDKRFNALKHDVLVSIAQQDCFGIQPEIIVLTATGFKAFDFPRAASKVDAFMDWLEEQQRIGILEITRRPGGLRGGIEEAWTDRYIHSAYARGIMRGRTELSKAGYDVRSVGETSGGVDSIMTQPFHADRVGVAYTRTFEDLKSVTQIMNAQTRRLIAEGLTIGLARGIAEGKSPIVIARELYKDVAHRIDKIGKVRARMIARTEVIRAHHLATIAEYRQADMEMMIGVKAEWSTAGFDVCFPAGVLIRTRIGHIPIEHIKAGDEVYTRKGLRKVSNIINRNYNGLFIKLITSVGSIIATEDHPFWIWNYGWTQARHISVGDLLQSKNNQPIKVISCENFLLTNSNDSQTKRIKKTLFSQITRLVFMPIGSINFNNYVWLWKKKIHGLPSKLFFLFKGNIQSFQRFACQSLYRCFASIFSVTRKSTKDTFTRRNIPKTCPTILADFDMGRSSTAFRTIISSQASRNIAIAVEKQFSTSFAFDISPTVIGASLTLFLAIITMNTTAAFFTNEYDFTLLAFTIISTNVMLMSFITRHSTKFHIGIRSFVFATGIKSFLTPFARFMRSFACKSVITRFRAKSMFTTVNSGLRAKLKLLVTKSTGKFKRHDKDEDNIQGDNSQAISCKVYNLQVEEEQEFFANGILVHNCSICAGMEGREFTLNEIEGMIPAHPNCRCVALPVVMERKQ